MDITAFLDEFTRWAAAQPDVVGVALVGSHARGAATQASDVDVVMLTTNVEKYMQDWQWASRFGSVNRTDVERWGVVETLRAFYTDGREIEFNFSSPDWAGVPADPGTYRVVSDGMRILFDPQNLLGSVQRAVLEEHGREASEIDLKEPTMSQPLREPLEHLHRELGEADAVAHPSLSELHRDTRSTLEHPDPQAAVSADPTFRRRLEEAVRRYEASHPGVTRAAQNVLDVLTANGL